ncbi:TIGR02680 family protein [Sphaerisporangium album]|uniref:TIGR02680 family protein n=1 Tax=Sphaerisporangium album TaxID=509200 RepID=A0A367FB67_9ACTN|nr:TIGR02680 family protein [Sphaerisporangium album]
MGDFRRGRAGGTAGEGVKRFKPSRAGLINIWDYTDEEFVFADGRLVLRGHNGSGKTKALEVLFPFVLDGVVDARRLDPFSGENRTMKSNLLYRGQESEHGFVWMEFADGARTVTLVIALHAHKDRPEVKRAYFVTDKRLGVDFGLLTGDSRPLTERQLKAVLGPGAWHNNPTDYREAVDAALFGLGRERYTQLLDLLLALRRPLLAKDLDPAKVSDTLTAGLSPVSDELVEQASRDFENLAAVQRLMDDLAAADGAARVFLERYSGYLRVAARAHLDRVRVRTDQAVRHAAAVSEASAETRRADAAQREAEEAAGAAAAERNTLEGTLEGLKRHEAYTAQGELESTRRLVAQGAQEIARAGEANARAAEHIAQLRGEAEEVERRLGDAREAALRLATARAEAAELAGITPDVAPEAPADDTAGTEGKAVDRAAALQVVRAQAAARAQDVEDVRLRLGKAREAERERARAEEAARRARQRTDEAELACAEAEAELGRARVRADEELRAWAARWSAGHTAPITGTVGGAGIGSVGGSDIGTVGVGTVRAADTEALAAALARAGEAGAPSLAEVFGDLTEARRTTLAAGVAAVEARLERIAAEASRLTALRDEVAAERDDAPPLAAARHAGRDGRPGAPLWRLVRFADAVSGDEAAAVEGALDAAGLLTAWIHPDLRQTAQALDRAEPDAYLLPRPGSGLNAPSSSESGTDGQTSAVARMDGAAADAPGVDGAPPAADVADGSPSPPPTAGRTLASVLVPEEQDLVPVAVVSAVLGSIALTGDLTLTTPAPAISTRGHFSLGVHVGAGPKPAAEYIGATNRAARRRARIAEYERSLEDVDRDRVAAEAERATLRERLDDIGRARSELRRLGREVPGAVAALAERSTLLAAARGQHAEAATGLDAATAELDAERRRLRHAAAERGMPSGEEEVEAVARAVADYAAAAERLLRERDGIALLEQDLTGRRRTIERLAADLRTASEELAEKEEAHLAAAARLAALEDALSAPLKQILAQINEVERKLAAAKAAVRAEEERARAEHDALVTARAAYDHGRGALVSAVAELFEQLASFAPFVQADLRPVLGVDPGPSWPDRTRWEEPERAVAGIVERLSGRAPAEAADPAEAAEAVRSILPDGAVELLALCEAATAGRQAGEAARKAARERMSEALKEFDDALTGCEEDYRVDWEQGESVVIVRVHDADGRHPVAEFARRVAERAEEQGVLLEERERTVLEDELLAGLAQQIFDRVLVAKDLVKGMDADTRSRPMSTGTTVGIRWVVSDRITDLQREVSALLEQDGHGADRLAELRRLIRQMIREYRAGHPRATYKEVLFAVLDYRAWRSFELRLKVPGEDEVRLSKKRHSQMSGGEKSAAIHLPLFAAANALYSSASGGCPRMIALDEAFAGIDDVYKPDLLGLTVRYDLDVFMTGHDLWARYETVPAAAHYDMHSDKASHTVSAMLVLWDGCELVDSAAGFSGNEELAKELLGFTPSRRSPLEAGLLTTQGDDPGGAGRGPDEGDDLGGLLDG